MSERRNMLLEEMGLGPQWRLRSGAAVTPALVPEALAVQAPPALKAVVSEPPVVQPVGTGGDRTAAIRRMDWDALRTGVAACEACALHKSRHNTVFGVGDENADWLIIGEAPGAEEDAKGEPFVGQAGRLLESMLHAIGLERGTNVYIANVLKCRPPGNRNPEAGEVAQCSPYLSHQIELIQPRLIVAMGRFAAQTLLGSDASIASLRGRIHTYQGRPLVVTYHPAYLLRSLTEKAKAWEDLCLARKVMQGLATGAKN